MKIVLVVLILALAASSSAAIINIPADYPAIQQGIDASNDGDTVLVQPGTYYENINFNGHNIVLGSLFLTTGDTSYIGQTVIDGGNNTSAVVFSQGEDSTAAVCGFSIRHGLAFAGGGVRCENADPRITYNIIEDNLGDSGGGIYCSNSGARIENNIIRDNNIISPLGNPGGGICCLNNSDALIRYNIISDNINQDGGGIAVAQSAPRILNNLIYGNRAFDLGGAVRSDYGSPVIINNTFADNYATTGGGIYLLSSSGALITSSIFWNDSAGTSDEIHLEGGSPTIAYCDIEGGWPGEGNIDADPLFRDPVSGNYRLMSGDCGYNSDSPGIDAGNPNYMDFIMDCEWGLGLSFSDMGAYGGIDSCTLAIGDIGAVVQKNASLIRVYPSPFNQITLVEFHLVRDCYVTIDVIDINGRITAELVNGYRPAGRNFAEWDASGCASGVYFCRLEACEFKEIRKMVLIR